MKMLLKYLKKNIYFYVIGSLCILIGTVIDMFNPRLIRVIIDDVIMGRDYSPLKLVLWGMAGITIGRCVLGYLKEIMFDMGSSKIMMHLRKELFDHIQSLSFSFFDEVNTGELMSRIKEDVDNVWNILSFGAMLIIEQSLYFFIASALLFTLNWKLAIMCMVALPVIAFLAMRLEKKIREAYGKISDQRAALNTTAQENLAGVRLVKAFGREKYEITKFLGQNRKNFELCVEQAGVWAKYHPRIEFLSNLVIVLVTTIGGLLVIGNDMTVGTLVAFSNYVFMLIWPMRMIGWLTNLLAQCNASLKKIQKIFEEEPSVKNPEGAKTPDNIQGHVKFEGVSLEFNGTEVLKNIDIDVEPGKTVAIMGMTGAGKSSIINLLARYYDCTEGRVIVDGLDVRQWELSSLRRQISFVMQDTFLFSDEIGENIKFGNEGLSEAELLNIAADAKVDEFADKMSDGYSTVIGERGIGLSGGQKQRIAIARALAKKGSILVLDDATSALDMETEYEIQKSLEKKNNVTKFIIAHRISAVRNADEILIVDNGEIVERGSHDELLELGGKYYNTYCEQCGRFNLLKEEVV